MRSDPYKYKEPSWVGEFIRADTSGKLSSKDRLDLTTKRTNVAFAQDELVQSLAQEIVSAKRDLKFIDREIQDSKSPKVREILATERNKILELISTKDKFDKEQKAQEQLSPPSLIDIIGDSLKNLWTVSK